MSHSTAVRMYAPAVDRRTWHKTVLLDRIAGVLIAIGLTWPFLWSSMLPVPWWVWPPLAALGGFLRQRSYPRPLLPHLPIWLFFTVLLLYLLLAWAIQPMPDSGPMPYYGQTKALYFVVLGGLAYLATFRMRPLTAALADGLRWGLGATLLAALAVTIHNRHLFLDTYTYGLDAMVSLFSTTGFPLTVALAALCLLPRTLKPLPLMLSSVALLAVAGMEVFVRGRFAALALGALAVLLMLGPPWRNLFWRVVLCAGLAVVAYGAYHVILPSFGESYRYLEALGRHPFENRDMLFTYAWHGFAQHPMGQGIGSFARGDYADNYPHNIFLEMAFESGVPGLIAICVIYLASLVRGWQLWRSPPHRLFPAMLGITLIYMLKAGDLATWAFQWVFLYTMVVATPVSLTWPVATARTLE